MLPNSIKTIKESVSKVSSSAAEANPELFYNALRNAAVEFSTIGPSKDPNKELIENKSQAILSYPMDLGKYYMLIFIDNYTRPSIVKPLQLQNSKSIALPLPSNLNDLQVVAYSQDEYGALLGVGADIISSQMQGAQGGKAAGGYQGLASKLANIGSDIGGAALGLGGQILLDSTRMGQLAQNLLGIASNPWLTVQLQSPMFKEHSFTWTFSPNSPEESARLKLIIDTLRYHMLPSLTKGTRGIFLNYPDLFRPVIVPNASTMYFFKYCVGTSMNVHYAPLGTPSFFAGTEAPTSIMMTLNLLEIEIHLKDNFEGNHL